MNDVYGKNEELAKVADEVIGDWDDDADDLFRFSKLYNEKSPALDLDGMFRLYLIGKIINLEILYQELMEPLKNQE